MTDNPLVTRFSLPDDKGYRGFITHDLGNGREIVVSGYGEDAERVLRQALEERDAAHP